MTSTTVVLLEKVANFIDKYGTNLSAEDIYIITSSLRNAAANLELKEEIAALKEQTKTIQDETPMVQSHS